MLLWLGKSRETTKEVTARPVDPRGRLATQREH